MNRIALAFIFFLATVTTAPAAEIEPEASMPQTLAWIKQVDAELVKPRYADLTLDQLRNLTALRLGGHRKLDRKHLYVAPEDFRHLVPLSRLQDLHLGENDGVTDAALVHVAKLGGLRKLVLWDAPVSDAGIRQLVGLKQLSTLDLAFARKISAASLSSIAQTRTLRQLNLAGTAVDDVSALVALPDLTELRLGKLRPAGVAALKQANPALVIR